jgi:hypothetical protein
VHWNAFHLVVGKFDDLLPFLHMRVLYQMADVVDGRGGHLLR